MEVQTFRPTYLPTTKKQGRATKTTTLPDGEQLDYRRMKIRADLIDLLDALKPEDKSLTVFLNNSLASFLTLKLKTDEIRLL